MYYTINFNSQTSTSKESPMLTDINGFYKEMFYSLDTAVKGIYSKNMVESSWKGMICWNIVSQ